MIMKKNNMGKFHKKLVAALAAAMVTVYMAACGTKENKDLHP